MAHYAFLDENNVVTEVITGRNEDEIVEGVSDWEAYYGEVRNQVCKRTSYNTYGGVNLAGGVAFRKNYAAIGYTYDAGYDAFIPPKPFNSWILNENTCQWESPIAYPTDGLMYEWSEDSLNWQSKIFPTE